MTTRYEVEDATATPGRRGRLVGVGAPVPEPKKPAPPPAFELVDDDGAELYVHPSFYVEGVRRRRWSCPLLVLETLKPDTVARWDHAEHELEKDGNTKIVGRRIVLRKWDALPGASKKQWLRVGDGNEDPGTMNEGWLSRRFGPGAYQAIVYAVAEDTKGESMSHQVLTFGVQIAPVMETSPAPVAPPALAAAAAPGFSLDGPRPSSFQEWLAYQEAIDRAEERKRVRAREEEERKDRDEERRRARDRADEERKDREEERKEKDADRRRERAREDEERKEKDAERKSRREAEQKKELDEMTDRMRASGSVDPLERIAAAKELLEKLGQFGGVEKESTAERIFGTIATAFGGQIPALKEIALGWISSQERIARVEMQLSAYAAQQNPANHSPAPRANPPTAAAPPQPKPAQHVDPRVVVTPAASPAEAASASPSVPADEPSPAAVTPAGVVAEAAVEASEETVLVPGDDSDLGEGDPCPETVIGPDGNLCPCGAIIGSGSCDHYDVDDDDCDECPTCEHDVDDDEDCAECPPCPHGDAPESVESVE